ncbi:MAG: MBL fold metallo-hydrolase [Lachnospiraceae bacterium]|nr:MBL fold metallo-hydrolase [Lachnospiraceae bacterium]
MEMFVKELEKGLYLLDEGHAATGYLVVGEERACLIDTMMGYNDLSKVTAELTDKPVTVVNTHGHPDHIYGNVYFKEAYMHPADYDLAELFVKDPAYADILKARGAVFPPFKPIREGDSLDLGGRTLAIFEIPGHTPGGIMLLLKEERILFTGDSINHHLWMQVPGASPMADFVKSLDRIMFLEKEADRILHGHAQGFDDISLMRCLRRGAVEIAEGKTEEDKPYSWSGGDARMHSFRLEEGKQYTQSDSVICYN